MAMDTARDPLVRVYYRRKKARSTAGLLGREYGGRLIIHGA